MPSITLCNYKDSEIEVHVEAIIAEGKLLIQGQDLGKKVMEFWDDSDYEYWYSFSKEETRKLAEILGVNENWEVRLLEAIAEKFSGMHGDVELANFCKENNIEYKFFSYA